ncbi:MAG: biopolymer transporter ExbD [Planctomycetota bacterium]
MKLQKDPPRKARMEIVPLIDVMFLVLASFVYASSDMTLHRGLHVDLPQAATSQLEKTDHLTITVTATDEVYLDKDLVSLDALGARLLQAAIADPSLEVRINGDEKASHGGVVKVLDAVRRAGIVKVDVESRRSPTGEGR